MANVPFEHSHTSSLSRPQAQDDTHDRYRSDSFNLVGPDSKIGARELGLAPTRRDEDLFGLWLNKSAYEDGGLDCNSSPDRVSPPVWNDSGFFDAPQFFDSASRFSNTFDDGIDSFPTARLDLDLAFCPASDISTLPYATKPTKVPEKEPVQTNINTHDEVITKHIDGSASKQTVREAKAREQNRVAAAKIRAKKKMQVASVNKALNEKSERNSILKKELRDLRDELVRLRMTALEHQGCCGEIATYNDDQAITLVRQWHS